MAGITCANCGADRIVGAEVCPRCGANLRTGKEATRAAGGETTPLQPQVTPAQWYGYCSACRASVWVTPEGGCAAGHDPSCISGIQATQPSELAPEPQKASTGLLVVGWIFAVLGGLIGIFLAAHIGWGKVKTPSGSKVYKYDQPSRSQGHVMLVVVFVAMFFWIVVSFAMSGSS